MKMEFDFAPRAAVGKRSGQALLHHVKANIIPELNGRTMEEGFVGL